MIKGLSSSRLKQMVRSMTAHPGAALKSGISLTVDVDPYSLM
ncbi:MAG: hypothetical protein MI862_17670 [Desulfobacterales bacterium]|nr:hypothetical protein [Desulfobacterales bacterium]